MNKLRLKAEEARKVSLSGFIYCADHTQRTRWACERSAGLRHRGGNSCSSHLSIPSVAPAYRSRERQDLMRTLLCPAASSA